MRCKWTKNVCEVNYASRISQAKSSRVDSAESSCLVGLSWIPLAYQVAGQVWIGGHRLRHGLANMDAGGRMWTLAKWFDATKWFCGARHQKTIMAGSQGSPSARIDGGWRGCGVGSCVNDFWLPIGHKMAKNTRKSLPDRWRVWRRRTLEMVLKCQPWCRKCVYGGGHGRLTDDWPGNNWKESKTLRGKRELSVVIAVMMEVGGRLNQKVSMRACFQVGQPCKRRHTSAKKWTKRRWWRRWKPNNKMLS